MSENAEIWTLSKPFNPNKRHTVVNPRWNFDAEIFQEDFFNMSDIPEVYKDRAKLLEYEILYSILCWCLYKDEAMYPWWRWVSFLELLRNWDLFTLIQTETQGNLFVRDIDRRIKEFVKDVDDYNCRDFWERTMKIIW